ncbi:MAG: hypothetical protein JO119_00605 [Acidobacteria bacterium]|nr:hypothetical protein [Acidobacteriota bacterium]
MEIYTSSRASGDDRHNWQQIDVRVYNRENRKERWGYFVVNERANHEPGPVTMAVAPVADSFDGHRLQIHFTDTTDIPPFDLDIMFSPGQEKWMGTWSHAGENEDVVLARPEPSPGAKLNPFVGRWIGQPNLVLAPTTLNVRQSLDGVVSASLDRTLAATDRRNGEQLNVKSITDTELVLTTNNPAGATSQFRGTLSADGLRLSGSWESPGGGGTLNAATQFRRASAEVSLETNPR